MQAQRGGKRNCILGWTVNFEFRAKRNVVIFIFVCRVDYANDKIETDEVKNFQKIHFVMEWDDWWLYSIIKCLNGSHVKWTCTGLGISKMSLTMTQILS